MKQPCAPISTLLWPSPNCIMRKVGCVSWPGNITTSSSYSTIP